MCETKEENINTNDDDNLYSLSSDEEVYIYIVFSKFQILAYTICLLILFPQMNHLCLTFLIIRVVYAVFLFVLENDRLK